MSVDRFKFISPGIFVNEIDNTGRSALPADIGPVLIGRSEKGPILTPTKVNDFADFINEFGMPIPGGNGTDVSRNGNYISPTYAAYAAQAWFRNNAPITYVRLGGQSNASADNDGGLAGWITDVSTPTAVASTNGGAYGLFVCNPTLSYGSASIVINKGSLTAPASGMTTTDSIQIYFGTGSLDLAGVAPLVTVTASLTGATAVVNERGTAPTISGVPGGFSARTSLDGETLAYGITGSLLLALSGTDQVGKINVSSGTFGVVVEPIPSAIGASLPSLRVESTVGTAAHMNTGFQVSASHGATEGVGLTSGELSANLIASSSLTGTLAAVWYINSGAAIGLSGTCAIESNMQKAATSTYINSVGTQEFKVVLSGSTGTILDTNFDFTETSDKFIRKVFNTNPTLTNTNITTEGHVEKYWLGETYEGTVNQNLGQDATTVGVILPLQSGSAGSSGKLCDRRIDYQSAQSGWFISQDMTQGTATGSFDAASMQKLFKIVARNAGSWSSKHLKVSIQDLKRSPNTYQKYGSFTVALRRMDDTDNRIEYVEQFNNLNLNPNSENYIARRIGNAYEAWDETDRRYRNYGDYDNLSKYIRVEVNAAVDKGDTDPALLPFGVFGPIVYRDFDDSYASKNSMVSGGLDSMDGDMPSDVFISGSTDGDLTFQWPRLRMRISASEGDPTDPRNVYFGVDTTFNTSRLNDSVVDQLTPMSRLTSDFSLGGGTEHSFVFTLDDMLNISSELTGTNVYLSGSRQMTAAQRGTNLTYTRSTGSYIRVLEDASVDQFTTVLFGGFDGQDIKYADPLLLVNNTSVGTGDPKTDYMMNSVQVAIDSLRDPEIVEYNLAAMPGITNNTLNRSLVDLCEQRGDALAIIDLKHGYTPKYESNLAATARRGNVDQAVNNARNTLQINSSYGAAYYPWVQVRDTSNGQLVWAPPSVAALGAISYSQKMAELWFAPAGFTRGGLSGGTAGLPVTAVRQRLTSKQRDKLYEANINPIAQFPAEGIVIFGQKTLQATPSALDRINVRRLLIFLKREISRFAATVIFDQNVRSTWNRFRGRVEPFLGSVQARLGITKFKLVLDETTTTEDLIDRNIMYAKIFIKPARAIEYIALDFILTDNGAAFED